MGNRTLLKAVALGAALAGLSACSTVDPATRLTRELLAMPKEEAYAKGESLVAKKKYRVLVQDRYRRGGARYQYVLAVRKPFNSVVVEVYMRDLATAGQ